MSTRGNTKHRPPTRVPLADALDLPLRVVTEKLAFLGVTGSGKTYAATKLAESFWDAGAQFVVLDPVGTWYGLRLAADGLAPSRITVPIFGGLHGDIPLEPTGGEVLANLIVDQHLSAVLDVSQFESDRDKARFATAFAARLFFRKKAAPSAVHLFLEEAQEFAPQNPDADETRMLHAFTRLQKLGRNFGIGASYISQRPQEVNKKALNMAQTLFVFRTTGTQERAAIEKWISDKALDETIANDLPKLATGQCHVWSPEFLKVSTTVTIARKDTFNASATPEVGETARARVLAPVDLERVRVEMAATIERAKADDPAELRRQLAAARAALATARPAPPAAPALTTEDRRWLESLDAQLQQVVGALTVHDETLRTEIAQVATAAVEQACARWGASLPSVRAAFVDEIRTAPPWQRMQAVLRPTAPAAPARAARATDARAVLAADDRTWDQAADIRQIPDRKAAPRVPGLSPGEQAVLTAIVHYDEGLDRKRLGVLTAYKKSSRDTYIKHLVEKGLIATHAGVLSPTTAGRAAMNGTSRSLRRGTDLLAFWQAKLPPGERRVFEAILQAGEVARAALGEATGYRKSSRDTYLKRLIARGLVDDAGRGYVRPGAALELGT